MIDKNEYRILKRFKTCKRGFYGETALPKGIRPTDPTDLSELHSEGMLERFTLEPLREETPWKQALCGFRITRKGREEVLLFQKERSEKIWQLLQFLTATLLAIAALPGILDFFRGRLPI